MAHGDKTKLAMAAGLSTSNLIDILSGRRNVGKPETAKRLAALTATDPFLWMQGGSPLERQAAIESWSDKSVTAGQGQGIQNENGEM